jgi:hypothetical protein
MNNIRRIAQVAMSHTRDVNVTHTITNKIFISVPLYFEKGMIFQSARVQGGELIIEGKINKKQIDGSVQSKLEGCTDFKSDESKTSTLA